MSQSPTKGEKGKNREKETKNKLKRKKPLFVPEYLTNLLSQSLVSAGYATEYSRTQMFRVVPILFSFLKTFLSSKNMGLKNYIRDSKVLALN